MSINFQQISGEDFCYLTTVGRVTGRPHTIEIWFAIDKQTLYMLSGGREQADWVKNILRNPAVTIKIRDMMFERQARQVNDAQEDALARRLLVEKYADAEDDLEEWGRTSLPIAVDLQA
ncbi:MAG TPA: nitroreductase/quinone reductase family protein [Ktedonobacteraceae bacterium]|jgi:deazaflavin-dependent oxidoreductase (nitroreductase family)|nr:nitroreductase/quinone reductase family protein [Ktedonobacteraceae bacterium]